MGAGSTQRRGAPRWDCFVETTIDLAGREVSCTVTNISDDGAGAWCIEPDGATVGAVATLRLPDRGEMAATVRHVTGDVVGVAFADATDALPAAVAWSAGGTRW